MLDARDNKRRAERAYEQALADWRRAVSARDALLLDTTRTSAAAARLAGATRAYVFQVRSRHRDEPTTHQ